MKVLLLIIFTLLLFTNLSAQNATSREWGVFNKGLTEYSNGNFEMARQSFSLMINKLPNSPLTTANTLMLAKSNYKSGDYQASLQQCEDFKQKFPNSNYIDDVNYLAANNYYRLGSLESAIKTWLATAYQTNDPILKNKILNLVDDVIRYKMNRLTLEKLSQQNRLKPAKEAYQFHLLSIDYRNGNIANAKNQLMQLSASATSVHYKHKIKILLDQISGNFSSEKKIAALLPLSGVNESIGNALLKGLELALITYNNSAQEKLSLVKYDYKSDLLSALQQIKLISSNPSILAVFGPVENEISAACGAVAEYEGLTLLSPTATSDKIKSISNNCILLAPTVERMAESIHTFIYDSLGLMRVATFSPIDDYFIEMTNQFADSHIEKGGTIAAQEWYYPEDQNFKKQFRKLKRVGLKLEYDDSLKTKYPDMDDFVIDSLYSLHLEAEREELKETKTKIDSADIPVITFDGMFMPIYGTDISFLAPQFAYSNFKTQLIGNSDWYDMDELKKNRNYVNGIIFVSDGYLNEEDWDFRQFRNNFRNMYSVTPDKYELIAFDSFNYFSQIFNNDDPVTRNNIYEKILALKTYQGIYRSFAIDKDGTNKATRILKYIYGQIIPIK